MNVCRSHPTCALGEPGDLTNLTNLAKGSCSHRGRLNPRSSDLTKPRRKAAAIAVVRLCAPSFLKILEMGLDGRLTHARLSPNAGNRVAVDEPQQHLGLRWGQGGPGIGSGGATARCSDEPDRGKGLGGGRAVADRTQHGVGRRSLHDEHRHVHNQHIGATGLPRPVPPRPSQPAPARSGQARSRRAARYPHRQCCGHPPGISGWSFGQTLLGTLSVERSSRWSLGRDPP
jgi:hypothetical protein